MLSIDIKNQKWPKIASPFFSFARQHYALPPFQSEPVASVASSDQRVRLRWPDDLSHSLSNRLSSWADAAQSLRGLMASEHQIVGPVHSSGDYGWWRSLSLCGCHVAVIDARGCHRPRRVQAARDPVSPESSPVRDSGIGGGGAQRAPRRSSTTPIYIISHWPARHSRRHQR